MNDVVVSTRDEVERLYRDEGNRIWWGVLAYSGDREIASDAVAEAFASALRDADRIHTPLPWLWRVAIRTASAEMKRKRHPGSDQLAEQPYDMDAPSNSVLAVLAHLPRQQRAALVLHYYGGYSTKEIGELLGSAQATIAVHLHRGRKRLRTILEESDG